MTKTHVIDNAYENLPAVITLDGKEIIVEINGGFFHFLNTGIEKLTRKVLEQLGEECIYNGKDVYHYDAIVNDNGNVLLKQR